MRTHAHVYTHTVQGKGERAVNTPLAARNTKFRSQLRPGCGGTPAITMVWRLRQNEPMSVSKPGLHSETLSQRKVGDITTSDVVAHTCETSTGKRRQDDPEFEASHNTVKPHPSIPKSRAEEEAQLAPNSTF